MEYYIEDKQLLKLFNEKEKEIKAGRALEKKKNVIEEEQRKIGLKLNRLKEQMMAGVEKRTPELNIPEFEEITKLDVVKGKVKLTTTDLIEEYKKMIKDQRKKMKELNNPTKEGNEKKDNTKTDEPKK